MGGHGLRRSLHGPGKLGMRMRQLVLSPFVNTVNNVIYRTLCSVETVLGKLIPYTLISYTDAHAVRARPTLNDVERFLHGPVHKFYNLKAGKLAKYAKFILVLTK